jgi:hypothetical protein
MAVNTPTKTSGTSAVPSKQRRTPRTYGPYFSEMAARTFQNHPHREKASLRPQRPTTYCPQSATYIHLHAAYGGCRHLPNRQEPPSWRRDAREILGSAHQDLARCCCNQRHAAREKQERRENRPEHSGFTATTRYGNGCVKSSNVPYHEIRQPRAGVAEWHTQRT